MSDEAAEPFARVRTQLQAIAYRMLGSVAEAEDAVQDAYLRWHHADRARVADAGAYLRATITRLALDRLKSARARRETYVGPWLPEPVLDSPGPPDDLAHDVSFALMVALEQLSPAERAAFLLHDVFDMPFAEIARTLDRTPESCRQLAARARKRLKPDRAAESSRRAEHERLTQAFLAAAASGDTSRIAGLLAEDAVFVSDGGGRVPAALNPVQGRDRVARLVEGLMRKGMTPDHSVAPASLNGAPGFIVRAGDAVVQTTSFDIRNGVICAIYVVRNPDKLAHLQ